MPNIEESRNFVRKKIMDDLTPETYNFVCEKKPLWNTLDANLSFDKWLLAEHWSIYQNCVNNGATSEQESYTFESKR